MTHSVRTTLTLALAGGTAASALLPRPLQTIELGRAAGLQFVPSDGAAARFAAEMSVWSLPGLGASTFLALLVAIWWRPLRHLLAARIMPVAFAGSTTLLALLTLLAQSTPAAAYYNKQDYAEPYLIMPNESAFWVPDVGDNQSSQAAFASIEYLNKNKIASKRFLIPHARLSSSGFWSWSDYYVPTGRLYIIDRSPFNQEWVSSSAKGTSTRDEGFQCQSSEGLDINVGITISAFVTEGNAARFLFHYGVKPPAGSRNDPEVIFTSVFYGRSLTDVMQSNVRNAVQALVCRQLAGRTLVEDNAQANAIMEAVRTDIASFLTEKGITLDFIGWADTFTFDPKVQDALNRAFIASQDRLIAAALAPHASTVQALALAEAVRVRWNGAVPANLALSPMPQSLGDALAQFVGPRKAPPAQ